MLKYNFFQKNKSDFSNLFNYNLFYKYEKIIINNKKIIKMGNYGNVKFVNNFAIKSFTNINDYLNEKEIYTTKLPQYCGSIIKNNNLIIYDYYDKQIIFNPLYKNNNLIITDTIIINNVTKISSTQICKLIISNNDITIYAENNSDIIKIGYIIKDNEYKSTMYIDTFKIMRLLHFDDYTKSLYYENLGINLKDSFLNRHPSYEQRIFMSIDLIRQVKELIDLSIYHNDIKNENIVLNSINMNYYINLIDYGIAVTINDLLGFEYLTSPNSYSPEYYIINTLLHNKTPNVTKIINDLNRIFPDIYKKYNDLNLTVKNMKDLLDNSLHWIIGGMIINILSWKDVQYPIWIKHYNPNRNDIGYHITYLKHLNNYSSQNIALNYSKNMLCELFKNDFLYEDIFFFSKDDIKLTIDSINELNDYESLQNIIDDRFKDEYVNLIKIIYNLFEFSPNKKMSLSLMYDKLKNYPEYQKYLNSKPKFL